MAVDLYFAGSQCKEAEEIIEQNGYCRLYSYFNDKKNLKDRFERKVKGKLIVDSGAFTAWTKEIEINVDEYISWLNANKEYIYLAGQVDKIPGRFRQTIVTREEVEEAAQKTYDNYWYMRARLDNPDMLLYTFHLGEPFDYLKRILKHKEVKYIALGGMVGKTAIEKENFCQRCFDIIKSSSNPDIKVHAFGMTSIDLLKKFPFQSADSTGWIMTGAMGCIYSRYGILDLSKNNRYKKESIYYLPKDSLEELKKEISESGYTLEELEENYRSRMCYNLKYLHEQNSKLKQTKFQPKKSLF